ncbi:arginine deiminase [Anaerofustis stercorihominis]|uniref:Arginine deiminase n=1 Tax=Anaerofustis stercorihominis DSM 17244 TaxID=445971 RepID=B1CBQ7_9FIRM|nr:arginine deiminase [Anaerofustis stercorihominis]EDS71704.1 putative arginine deiminase [Anaerofustis stercorihominis DSM 17244]MCQ4796239.1 arginine deiminase [Anaerofustis stercorihominis]
MDKLSINSEIGKLNKILLHRPGFELDRITPEDLKEVLFDDIPWMSRMRKEHDGFAKVLKETGTEVLFVTDCLLEVINNNEQAKKELVELALEEVQYDNITINGLREFLLSLDNKELIRCIIAGLSESEVKSSRVTLSDYMQDKYPYYFKPIPNLYFMRDVGVVIKNGVALSRMKTPIRRRESLIVRLIYKYHPDFSGVPVYFDNKEEKMSLEGGDVLILSKECVLIGFSERTSLEGIDKLASNLLNSNSGVKKVLAVKIPHERAFMHLDTVFTMVDYDKFVIFPNILNDIEVITITSGGKSTLKYEAEENLKTALAKALNLPSVKLIKSGGSSSVISAREQWNDSTNTLAISPGVVITYNRNEISNEILDRNGIKVLSIEGSELVRGRGGPRCMSMPLVREDIDF